MDKKYLNGFTAAVTANGMFCAIGKIPLHQSASGFDPLSHMLKDYANSTSEDIENSKLIEKHRKLLTAAAYLGERASLDLIEAFETNTVSSLNAKKTICGSVGDLLMLSTNEEIEDLIKFANAIKNSRIRISEEV